MVRGLGLAPIVAMAINGDYALMLCAAAALLLTATRVLAVAICHLTGNRFRAVVYTFSAAIVYIPAYLILYELFGSSLTLLGVYLPMMVVEPAIIKRLEAPEMETLGEALRRGINNTIGLCVSILLVGALRELLGAGHGVRPHGAAFCAAAAGCPAGGRFPAARFPGGRLDRRGRRVCPLQTGGGASPVC